MSVPVGITVPKLLPITGSFAPAFAVYYTLLAIRVSQARFDSNTMIGDKPSPRSSSASSTADPSKPEDLLICTRAHGNFVENVPLALLMGAIVEMNGGNRRALTAAFTTLLVARIAHVELGLKADKTMGLGRVMGHMTTMSFVLGMSGYAAWLVKGYWGY